VRGGEGRGEGGREEGGGGEEGSLIFDLDLQHPYMHYTLRGPPCVSHDCFPSIQTQE
jgi:hypothetical protein